MTEHETRAELAENPPASKPMGFGEAVKTCFKKYFSFEGCASRAELWWYYLFYLAGLLVLCVAMVAAFLLPGYAAGLLLFLALVAFFVAGLLPLYSALVRRMHDVGLNGILAFIPIAGILLSLLPSAQESVYRARKQVHPVAGTVGKLFLVLLTLSALSNAVAKAAQGVRESRNSADAEASSDFPDEAPPVPQERLEEILAEIVARESRIVTEAESDRAVVEAGCVYLHAGGCTFCVVPSEKSPYSYFRIVNPAPSDRTPNLLYVVYGRPTTANMELYADKMAVTEEARAEDELTFDADYYKTFYERAKGFTITWNPAVTIGGTDYEAIFTDVDED